MPQAWFPFIARKPIPCFPLHRSTRRAHSSSSKAASRAYVEQNADGESSNASKRTPRKSAVLLTVMGSIRITSGIVYASYQRAGARVTKKSPTRMEAYGAQTTLLFKTD